MQLSLLLLEVGCWSRVNLDKQAEIAEMRYIGEQVCKKLILTFDFKIKAVGLLNCFRCCSGGQGSIGWNP